MVTAFVAATGTKVSVYVLLRFYFDVFDPAVAFGELYDGRILVGVSVLAMIVASLVALYERDVKRLFAWSSVAQIGYVTLGIGLHNEAGLTGAISHLLNHGVTKGAIFVLLGGLVLSAAGGRVTIDALAGLGRRMPLTAFGLTIAGLSLVGVPGTAGFVSKWYLVLGALERGMWWVVVAVVAASIIALAYVWRVVEAAYLRPPGQRAPVRAEAPAGMLAAALAMAFLCVYFGFETSFSVGGARDAAHLLLGAAR
jgi:multicomponent Na+:H+ antiporter subunit D